LAAISTLDRSSLEEFQTQLIEAGFRPTDELQRTWVGSTPDCFRRFTNASQMRLVFQDGWPFRPPKVFVPGIELEHVNPEGEVCLWRPDDSSLQWKALEGLNERIEEWCSAAPEFRPEDAALDAHLYFKGGEEASILAVFDLGSISASGFADRRHGALHGIRKHSRLMELHGGPGTSESIPGRWYYRTAISPPPWDIDALEGKLGKSQRRDFEDLQRRVASRPVGSEGIVLLIWDTGGGKDAMAVLLQKEQTGIVAKPLIAAPNDEGTLRLRSGPDFSMVRPKHVVLFGAGAIGSHVALLLSESGLGHLTIVDCDLLRPGDVVRHAADASAVGCPKADIVKVVVEHSAPWTRVESKGICPWTLDHLQALTQGADLALDATGFWSFAQHVSVYFGQISVPLISAALYRGGSVARVRRQVLEADTPIYSRVDNPAYPVIPPADTDEVVLEMGCSSPVINAPPVSVAAAAALTAQVVIDSLTSRFECSDEVVEVYRPLDSPPFNKPGRVQMTGEEISNA